MDLSKELQPDAVLILGDNQFGLGRHQRQVAQMPIFHMSPAPLRRMERPGNDQPKNRRSHRDLTFPYDYSYRSC
jgi:UDP-N-acetylglucosamine 2-epimerase